MKTIYPANVTLQDVYMDSTDDDPVDTEMISVKDTIIMKLSNGITIKKKMMQKYFEKSTLILKLIQKKEILFQ